MHLEGNQFVNIADAALVDGNAAPENRVDHDIALAVRMDAVVALDISEVQQIGALLPGHQQAVTGVAFAAGNTRRAECRGEALQDVWRAGEAAAGKDYAELCSGGKGVFAVHLHADDPPRFRLGDQLPGARPINDFDQTRGFGLFQQDGQGGRRRDDVRAANGVAV